MLFNDGEEYEEDKNNDEVECMFTTISDEIDDVKMIRSQMIMNFSRFS